MRIARLLVVALALAVVALLPGRALATEPNNAVATYDFVITDTHHMQSADGDEATLTGGGTLSVHQKSVTGGGTFTLTDDGTSLAGTWEAVALLSFTPYGCFPEEEGVTACGGRIQLRALLTPEAGAPLEAIITIVCTIGDVPGKGRNATEGAMLDVPGLKNYNKQVGGVNVYFLITTSDGEKKDC